MAVPGGKAATQQGISPQQGAELIDCPPLAQQQPARGRPDGLGMHGHLSLRSCRPDGPGWRAPAGRIDVDHCRVAAHLYLG